MRDKNKYKRYLLIVLGIIVLLFLWLSILGYGRAMQNEWIDRFNPFLRVQYGYAVLPNQVPEKRKRQLSLIAMVKINMLLLLKPRSELMRL
ncbi:hypothetical protein [Lactiplantibacillus plantarum]|uniref:hypothetical protein n=1 Tax=Lactiplantibacillus plantarum TaxID=1590 RepID=UPI00280A6C2D|nr:hypothetical protein [Lactiplantibacillus plantarum]